MLIDFDLNNNWNCVNNRDNCHRDKAHTKPIISTFCLIILLKMVYFMVNNNLLPCGWVGQYENLIHKTFKC